MPVYEYECQACGHGFEASQRITEPKLTDCPACHQPKLERLIRQVSFQLKGGGWYRDGYGTQRKKRTDNDRIDRLTKALDEDKKKSAAESTSSSGSDTSVSEKSKAA
ncbi:MAG: zinc ribbon domain-containing protein [Myxococcales bacterium]|nr:zinc ribbon domain-containing protein [Myxococcota bacterium]MDW8281244.1 zinc ribbon domain-containing protein [Myxococcales bacterium]